MVNIATTFTATWVYIATGQPEIHSDAMSQKHKGKEKEKENMCRFQFEEKKILNLKAPFIPLCQNIFVFQYHLPKQQQK